MSASAHRRLHDPKYLQLHIPGNSHVQDVSGHGRHGTLVNSPTYAAGPFGHSCLELNGSTQCITVGGLSFLDGATQVTFSCLFAQDSIASAQDRLFGRPQGASSAEDRFLILADNVAGFVVYVTNGGAASLSYARPSSWVNSAWVHFACVYDGTNAVAASRLSCYVNGQSVASTSGAGTIPAAFPDLSDADGAISDNTASFGFDGKMADVRLYSCALTGDEVAALNEFDRR